VQGKSFLFAVLLSLSGAFLGSGRVLGQTTAYRQTKLVSDVAGRAVNVDPSLINPWGIGFKPGFPFLLSTNKRGVVKAFDASGLSERPGFFAIPVPSGTNPPAAPTGIVYDFTSNFETHDTPAQFMIASENGIISAWCCVDSDFLQIAIPAVDNSSHGAVYKGLAILTPAGANPFLAVTNFHSGEVEPYTNLFDPLAPPGSFTDPNLPAGYAPFGIQVIGSQVFITYALQDRAKRNPVAGPGNGLVDIFDLEGNFVRRFASHGVLNAPWGVVKASSNFGTFSNAILIGNFGDGTINAFDPVTGDFLGTLSHANGKPIINRSLWGLVFGAGGTGDPNTLYFTAGLSGARHGLFGAISVMSKR
jgi:uncharacterized protein (TIGR03118 family)